MVRQEHFQGAKRVISAFVCVVLGALLVLVSVCIPRYGEEVGVSVRGVLRQGDHEVKVPRAQLSRSAEEDVPHRARKPQFLHILLDLLLEREWGRPQGRDGRRPWRWHLEVRCSGPPLRHDTLDEPDCPHEHDLHIAAGVRLIEHFLCDVLLKAEEEFEELRRVVVQRDVENEEVVRVGIGSREGRLDGPLAQGRRPCGGADGALSGAREDAGGGAAALFLCVGHSAGGCGIKSRIVLGYWRKG